MIPISDRFHPSKSPVVTYAILAINIFSFVWEWQLDVRGNLSYLIHNWGVIPAKIFHLATVIFTTLNPAAWVAWLLVKFSLIQAMFLHVSFSHLLGNLLFLFVFGKTLENLLGHLKYLSFYLLCGIITFGFQILSEPTLDVPLVGANGAVAGVLGAYLYKFPKAKIDTILPLLILFIPVDLPAFFYLFWWFVQQIFYGIGNLSIHSSVNPFSLGYWMHGMGMVVGAILLRSLTTK